MKVRDLVAKLLNFDQELQVVTPGFDHSYTRIAGANEAQAQEGFKRLVEYYEGHSTGPAIKVIVIE